MPGIELLEDPIAQELLNSSLPAQLAYTWRDGTARVVPIWFHWDGREVVLGTPPLAPKVKAISSNPDVALSINGVEWPYKVLQIRGKATITTAPGLTEEYILAAKRYLGDVEGQNWADAAALLLPTMTRIAIAPTWVHILDFQSRFPSAVEQAMATANAQTV